jgi:hypothetical protein
MTGDTGKVIQEKRSRKSDPGKAIQERRSRKSDPGKAIQERHPCKENLLFPFLAIVGLVANVPLFSPPSPPLLRPFPESLLTGPFHGTSLLTGPFHGTCLLTGLSKPAIVVVEVVFYRFTRC